MHDKHDGTCYLCMREGHYWRCTRLHEHHCIHGTASRKLSEKWGLKVYLCPAHHSRLHDQAAGREDDIFIQLAAQAAFKEKYPDKDFRDIFGKNIVPLRKCSEKEAGAAINAAGTGDDKTGGTDGTKEAAGFILLDYEADIPF